MRRLLRELLKKQLPLIGPFDIVLRVHKTFYKEDYKKINNEIKDLVKSLLL